MSAGVSELSVLGWQVAPAMDGSASKVWLQSPDGEGGDFDREEFEAVLASGFVTGEIGEAISRFFWENF